MTVRHPKWWTSEHDSGWEKTKAAFRRDWEQTKHDLGSKSAPNLHQSVSDTVKQATAHDPNTSDFAVYEPAFRYGYGAQTQFKGRHWDDKLESDLRSDYPGDWNRDRDNIRHAYGYSSVPRPKH